MSRTAASAAEAPGRRSPAASERTCTDVASAREMAVQSPCSPFRPKVLAVSDYWAQSHIKLVPKHWLSNDISKFTCPNCGMPARRNFDPWPGASLLLSMRHQPRPSAAAVGSLPGRAPGEQRGMTPCSERPRSRIREQCFIIPKLQAKLESLNGPIRIAPVPQMQSWASSVHRAKTRRNAPIVWN